MLKIVFMGSDAIALPTLEWIQGSAVGRIVGVFTQPDRATGRGQKVQANAIKRWAESRGVPVLQPVKFAAADQLELARFDPDLTLVMAYGHILRQPVIDTPRLGTFNLHTSLLPKYRGASPIQTAVASGERETGVTLMKLVLELDAGPVAGTERVPIAPLDTATELASALGAACVPLLERCLPAVAAGTLALTPQVHASATFCRRLEKADSALDFRASATELAARINGLNPWPGCAVPINGQLVRFGLADPVPLVSEDPAEAGVVLGADEAGLRIATGHGMLRVRKLQRPGGRMLAATEFLRGFPVAAGTTLPSQPMPALVAAAPFPYRKG